MYMHNWMSWDFDDRWIAHALTIFQFQFYVIHEFVVKPGEDAVLELAEYFGGKDAFHELMYDEEFIIYMDKNDTPYEWGPFCSNTDNADSRYNRQYFDYDFTNLTITIDGAETADWGC